MTHGDSLLLTIEATQRSLEQRLQEAVAPHHDQSRPRAAFAHTDAFLAATSRHLAAVESVLLEPVRRWVPEGESLVHGYLELVRDLEQSLALLKARLYGESHAIHLSWAQLWRRVGAELTEHNRLERTLVDQLVRHGDPDLVEGLARRIFDAETRAPTRPHPMLPHRGLLGRITRQVWSVADRFWDVAEGRVIPKPVKPQPRTHDSLLAQYLVADPKFDQTATLVQHHQHTHRRRLRRRVR
ncbi:MAG: hypothetical protein ACLGH4_02865 [Actinomycetes bacterium]